jgi:hypothetical protein
LPNADKSLQLECLLLRANVSKNLWSAKTLSAQRKSKTKRDLVLNSK